MHGFTSFTSRDSLAALAARLKIGDLIFIRVPARPFREVATATGSWTNHVGIVVDAVHGEPTIFFYHTNVRTPRWVGFVFQRPEMHRIHHQHGRHKNNYGDITWWDMLFGTYENPREWADRCGFDDAKEQQLLEMLKYRDVHR